MDTVLSVGGAMKTTKISHYFWIGIFTIDGLILLMLILSLMFYSVQKLIISAIYSVFQLLGLQCYDSYKFDSRNIRRIKEKRLAVTRALDSRIKTIISKPPYSVKRSNEREGKMIIRTEKNKDYTVIANFALNDNNLSLKAKRAMGLHNDQARQMEHQWSWAC